MALIQIRNPEGTDYLLVNQQQFDAGNYTLWDDKVDAVSGGSTADPPIPPIPPSEEPTAELNPTPARTTRKGKGVASE